MSFVIYRSSAGSGKTRTLAKEYIKLALAGPQDSFRHILAVTFANKATQEMKGRMVEYLADFAAGRANSLVAEIQEELNLSAAQLQARSRAVLSLILHRYSQFSISTIDAFFQRVIRSFTREAGLLGNFRLEVDNDLVLDEVIAALMDELGPEHPQLTEWVVQFSRNKLIEGSSWNINRELTGFAKQLFNEDFKRVEREVLATSAEKHQEVLKKLRTEVAKFQAVMKKKADEALTIVAGEGLTVEDFNYKESGTAYAYFRKFSAGEYVGTQGVRLQSYLAGAGAWAAKGLNNAKMKAVAERQLLPILRAMAAYDERHGTDYHTAQVILKNYYAFGLLADITRKLQHYKSENNVMLLSDAPQFLQGVIRDSDTPFIYEKVGSWFNHYLIDEFQDTSRFQWENFVPLLREAADQNYDNLIVGDVKQSIYRWRGGDLQLLQREVAQRFGAERVSVRALDRNFRSAGHLVEFNNRFFAAAAKLVSRVVADESPAQVYADVAQQKSKWPQAGYVRIEFLEKGEEPWEERVLKQLPGWLEQLQAKGVALKDIAILVRENKEGQRIANFLLHHQQSPQAKPDFRYDVVSNESLRLDTAWSVNVLITAFQFLKNPEDKIARAQLAFELAGDASRDLFVNAQKNELAGFIPEEFILQARYLTKLSLFELTEELIRIFQLGHKAEELAYLQAFQDLVLEFSGREKTDMRSFLEWWEIYKSKKSIQVSGSVDAITILTVHRAKGLQFRFVLLPFGSWEMNHKIAPLLWVQSGDEPFKSLGPVAVTYSKDLEATHFAESYRQERTKSYLDNLNLLYVAFTRAEWGLIVFAPEPGTSEKLPTTAEVVFQVLASDPELSSHVSGLVFEHGEMVRLETLEPHARVMTTQLSEYASCDWRKRMVIKRQGREFFDAEVSDKRTKINRGTLLHQVLAEIEYKNDWAEVVKQYFEKNPIDDEGQAWVTARIQAMLEHREMAGWFDRQWQVKTEAAVLLPGDRQKRIDRVMFGKSATVIVDYKTGEKSAEDREQVEQYAGVLGAMGYPDVQAFLVYIPSNEVIRVAKGSTLNLFA
ncbi:MAG: UvrD-helicase domain-containing protein [Cyclobacteriaceae bacterium]|jgi:ATP-dependent exoDNAse (exonuclease V) beta subunit|nr:UvrD-helicase domain-containing protein [Cyclobacteriaceae bacterium]